MKFPNSNNYDQRFSSDPCAICGHAGSEHKQTDIGRICMAECICQDYKVSEGSIGSHLSADANQEPPLEPSELPLGR